MDSTPNSSSCWSNIVKTQPPQSAATQTKTVPAAEILAQSCNSTEGIAVAVVDANAIIQGAHNLTNFADKFVTVPETLSDVDLKLIALTCTLETQMHGTKHLRDAPPPVHTVNVKRLPEKDLPGWGSNVANLEEWEALDNDNADKLNTNSRILPLRDLNLNVIAGDYHSENGSVESQGGGNSENQEDGEHGLRRPRRYLPKKIEVNIEGKKMVAAGIDASQGQVEDDAGDWMPAVSRSTHRRYVRRKARREYYESLTDKDSQQEKEMGDDSNNVDESGNLEQQLHLGDEEARDTNGISEESEITETSGSEELSSILKQMRLEEDSLKALPEGNEVDICSTTHDSDISPVVEATSDINGNSTVEGGEVDTTNENVDQMEISSKNNEIVDVSYVDDECSEQSWMLRSLSESTVACITGDYAMQNVILQMGLRLLAPGGMQIRQLHRWILKCHACYTITAEIGRIFCPKCGNGGTLRKVAVTVGENGIVLASRRPRITLRGTKFSLPMPQGGRDAITKNLILREDQLPQKYLYPRNKKKVNKEGDNFFTSDDIFKHHTDKRAPLQPPIRKALAVFSGRRNPNDNHYSHPKH
ncbi:RNA-binding NOB1-like protein [Citrus sinensis]|nr:RNA-binding NOB1-like protein [Citrus sinensis]